MQSHRAAELLPLLDGVALDELAADIRANGLRDPIVLLGEQILDGRNRWRACEIAGVEPRTRAVTLAEIGSPTAYVMSANLHRRHLTPSQRGMIAAEAADLLAVEAKERQREGGRIGGLNKLGAKVLQNSGEASANAPAQAHHNRGVAAEAGALLGVSHDTVEKARKVRRESPPETVEAVKRGEMTLHRATAALTPKPKKKEPEGRYRISPRAAEIYAQYTGKSPAGNLYRAIARLPVANQARVAEYLGSGEARDLKHAQELLVARVGIDPYRRALAAVRALPRDEQVRLANEILARRQ